MPIELEPDHKGTEIRLEGIKTMQGWAYEGMRAAVTASRSPGKAVPQCNWSCSTCSWPAPTAGPLRRWASSRSSGIRISGRGTAVA